MSTFTWPPIVASSVVGTETNDNAAAGMVGEYIFASTVKGIAHTLTTATTESITAIALTPGDWDISASVGFTHGAITSVTNYIASITTSSSGLSPAASTLAVPVGGEIRINEAHAATVPVGDVCISTPQVRASLAVTTNYYINVQCTFTLSSVAAFGAIWARRVR